MVELPDWEELDREDLRFLGKFIRSYGAFPRGANVTFWKRLGDNHVKAITYERGVEDFTLACGTGAGSTALALYLWGETDEGAVQLDFPGGELTVSLALYEGKVTDIYLTGPATVVPWASATHKNITLQYAKEGRPWPPFFYMYSLSFPHGTDGHIEEVAQLHAHHLRSLTDHVPTAAAANFLSLNFLATDLASMPSRPVGRILAAAPMSPVSSSVAKSTFSI